jgi:hypothetical protein
VYTGAQKGCLSCATKLERGTPRHLRYREIDLSDQEFKGQAICLFGQIPLHCAGIKKESCRMPAAFFCLYHFFPVRNFSGASNKLAGCAFTPGSTGVRFSLRALAKCLHNGASCARAVKAGSRLAAGHS